MNRVVFLDRDGTINKDVNYLREPSQLQLLPGTAKAIHCLKANGFLVIIVTNQSGIARGFFSEIDLRQIHKHLQNQLAIYDATVDAIYYCPHHPLVGIAPYRLVCSCRKPKIGLLKKAMQDFKIDLSLSYVIGDKPSDVLMGKKAGCQTVLISSHINIADIIISNGDTIVEPDFIASDLPTSTNWILGKL